MPACNFLSLASKLNKLEIHVLYVQSGFSRIAQNIIKLITLFPEELTINFNWENIPRAAFTGICLCQLLGMCTEHPNVSSTQFCYCSSPGHTGLSFTLYTRMYQDEKTQRKKCANINNTVSTHTFNVSFSTESINFSF